MKKILKKIYSKPQLLIAFGIFFLFNSCNFCNCKSKDDLINDYFKKIQNNEAELTAFFSQMPKGGDLHNHFTGSIYAETYWTYAVENKYFIDTLTLQIFPAGFKFKTKPKSIKQLGINDSTLTYNNLKQRIFQDWSVKDYYDALMPGDKHFFDAFRKFPFGDSLTNHGLLEIKTRAKAENVQYIELMFKSVSIPENLHLVSNYDSLFEYSQRIKDTISLKHFFDSLTTTLINSNVDSCALVFCNYIENLHRSLHLDDSDFTMRYLTYANRTDPPSKFFEKLYAAFKAADSDTLVVGVNILSPEDNEVAMHDYWLHMQMFKYCHQLFPTVKYAMHAGELTEGLVKPEDLMYHIHDAIFIAGANRIGHGVDIPYEKDCFSIMAYMRNHNIPTEINLSSNEFILKVKDDEHPVILYFQNKVPIVISDDDAGILRTSLTEQYVLLAKRYNVIHYEDIKRFVYNSIEYGFIKNPEIKKRLFQDLDKRFVVFENNIVKTY